jgi:hypothetical protein
VRGSGFDTDVKVKLQDPGSESDLGRRLVVRFLGGGLRGGLELVTALALGLVESRVGLADQ